LLAPVDDDDLENLLLARSPRFQALLDKSRGSIRAGKGLEAGDFWKAVAHRHRKQTTRKQASEVSRLGRPNQSAAADTRQKRGRG